MRWRILLLTCGVALTGCAAIADDPADVQLHLLHRLDTAFNPGPGGIDRPASGPVRFALPNGWAFLVVGCMKDAGFTTVDYDREDGFINVAKTGDGALAWYGCTQQLPEYDTVYAQFDDAELEALYDYYEQQLVPCLGAAGAPVSGVPGREDFAAGGAGQPGWWNPYLGVVPPASTADVDLLFAKCAPYPDTERP
jgi:hypothetical protein